MLDCCCCCCFFPLNKTVEKTYAKSSCEGVEMPHYKENILSEKERINLNQEMDKNEENKLNEEIINLKQKIEAKNEEIKAKDEEIRRLKNNENIKSEEYECPLENSQQSFGSNKSKDSTKSNFSKYSVNSQNQIKKMEEKNKNLQEQKKNLQEQNKKIQEQNKNLQLELEKFKNPEEKKKIKFIFFIENDNNEYPLDLCYGNKDKFLEVYKAIISEYPEFIGIRKFEFNGHNIDFKSLIKDNNFTDNSKIIAYYEK